MPLMECMEKHTERQLYVWLAWFNLQMNKPSRSDYYLMQIARMLCKQGTNLQALKLVFDTMDKDSSDNTRESNMGTYTSSSKDESGSELPTRAFGNVGKETLTDEEKIARESAIAKGRWMRHCGTDAWVMRRNPDGTMTEIKRPKIANKQSGSDKVD